MRLIDADAFKTQVAAVTALKGLNVEKAALLLMLIDQQPTVDAEPMVHARWEVNTDDFTPKKRCTNCGYNKPMKAGDGIEQEPEAFCPSCGARMDADAPERAGKDGRDV